MNNFDIGVESVVLFMKIHFVLPNVGFYRWCSSYFFVYYRVNTRLIIQTYIVSISYIERFVKEPAVEKLSLKFCQVVNLHIFELIRLWTCHKHVNKDHHKLIKLKWDLDKTLNLLLNLIDI